MLLLGCHADYDELEVITEVVEGIEAIEVVDIVVQLAGE